APELIDWTSEPSRTLEYGVTAAPVLKGDGFVALWPQVPPGVVTARPEDTRREAVAVVPADATAAKRFVHLNAPLSANSVPPLKVTLEGYYRGQRPPGETLVALERTPVRILAQVATPTSAGFAVRADKRFRGAEALVLD